MKILFTHLSMIPVHFLEGLSVRFGFARLLYRALSTVYDLGRPLFYYGEDYLAAAAQPGDRILDLGSGTGYLSRILSRKSKKIFGVEMEIEMVRKAVRRNDGVTYIVADMTRLPFRSECFDRAVSLGALHCVDPARLFPEVCRVLRPGMLVHVLSEIVILPRFAPEASAGSIRAAMQSAGMEEERGIEIGCMYRIFQARKVLPSASR